MAFAFLNKFFGETAADPRDGWKPLYAACIAEARQPHWYLEGQVPDSIDGRFDMLTLIVSLAIIRLERLGEEGAQATAYLTELLVEDMEGQVREIGFGDLVVGKHVGKMMGAFGGRLGAYRDALQGSEDLADALVRNLYRGEAVAAEALDHATAKVREVHATQRALSLEALKAGQVR
jgi:cytochrome b pre-mRNA-processing protein 3